MWYKINLEYFSKFNQYELFLIGLVNSNVERPHYIIIHSLALYLNTSDSTIKRAINNLVSNKVLLKKRISKGLLVCDYNHDSLNLLPLTDNISYQLLKLYLDIKV